jgi:hypothetical protein
MAQYPLVGPLRELDLGDEAWVDMTGSLRPALAVEW